MLDSPQEARPRSRLAATLRTVALLCLASAAGSWSLGGCVHPPVLTAAPSDLHGFEASDFDGAEVVRLGLGDGEELVGVRFDAGPNAPVVLHLREAGASVTSVAHRRNNRYDRLLDEGYTSLAFDYRGVGLSGGDRAPGRLVRDARAMYDRAVTEAGGDESRVVLRATSLGSVLAATLVADGARPGAIVAFAPVEARSMARRYAAQFWWGFVYYPIAPFLKRLTGVGTLDTLAEAPCPTLVFTRGDDCFSSPTEVRDFADRAAERELLSLVEDRSSERVLGLRDEGFQEHMATVRLARDVAPSESALLLAALGEPPCVEERVRAVLRALEAEDRARLKYDLGALACLRRVVTVDRHNTPEVMAAAALAFPSAELESDAREWVSSRWWQRGPGIWQGEAPPRWPSPRRTMNEMLSVFWSGEGARDAGVIATTRDNVLRLPIDLAGEVAWTEARVRGLALALSDRVDEGNEAARRSGGDAVLAFEPWDGRSITVLWSSGGSSWSSGLQAATALESLGLPAGSTDVDRIEAALARAAWVPLH